jgi:hypothetical protein
VLPRLNLALAPHYFVRGFSFPSSISTGKAPVSGQSN